MRGDPDVTDYGAPASEFSEGFVDKMRRRMAVSFHKYGTVADAAGKVDCLSSLETRLAKYREDGNTEWLIDAANFAMMEFMHPQHPNAHYEPTDSGASPGRTHATDAPGTDRRISAKRNEAVRGTL